MAGRRLRPYAVELLKELRYDRKAAEAQKLPAIDLAEVIEIAPQIVVDVFHQDVTYEEDDLMFGLDPATLRVGDVVVIGRDPSFQPIVLGKGDGNNEDPFDDPELQGLRDLVLDIQAGTSTWRQPVMTITDLPSTGNNEGDVRLVLDTNLLYRWDPALEDWVVISGGGGGGSFLPLSGGTMSGDITMPTTTMITLVDAPVDGTDAVNKDYVDDLISSVLAGALVPVITITTSYSASDNDQIILVDAAAGNVTVTLPAEPCIGKVYEVKDKFGYAETRVIDVVSADGDTIDGGSSFILTTNYQAIRLVFDGADWYIA